jgi:hypothetical protein
MNPDDRTERPATVPANVLVLASSVRHVADGPVVLVGNSMGGAISILLAARNPDLVSGLVLLDPALPPPLSGLQNVAVGTMLQAARRNPSWRYVELSGVGHVPQLQVPDRLSRILLGWLTATDRDRNPVIPRQSGVAGRRDVSRGREPESVDHDPRHHSVTVRTDPPTTTTPARKKPGTGSPLAKNAAEPARRIVERK